MTDIYKDGSYAKGSPSWHVEDSPWKSQQIKKIMEKNEINAKTICEVGCGAGEILNQLYQTYSSKINYYGFEISPQAYELCKKKENDKIHYYLNDLCKVEMPRFDVILLIDVIEHIEDMFAFLRTIKDKGEYKIFHIPLDISVIDILKGTNLSAGVHHPGHIHFFTKDVALEILRSIGYEILDYVYTPTHERPRKTLLSKIMHFPRKIVYIFYTDFGIRIFGGSSLMVLAK
jgi:SAM-dependent methyltransferase